MNNVYFEIRLLMFLIRFLILIYKKKTKTKTNNKCILGCGCNTVLYASPIVPCLVKLFTQLGMLCGYRAIISTMLWSFNSVSILGSFCYSFCIACDLLFCILKMLFSKKMRTKLCWDRTLQWFLCGGCLTEKF